MIAKLLALIPAEHRALVPRYLAAIVAMALAQIAAYLLAIPLLRALFDGNLGSAWRWTAALAVAVAVSAVFGYLQSTLGLRITVGMVRGMQTKLGDHLSTLPMGWFGATHSGAVSRTLANDVREILSAFSHLLPPVLTAAVVPLGVSIGVAFVDWRVALAMLVGLPVLAFVSRWANRSYAATDAKSHEAAAEANARVVEFAQAQPVLRAFGAVGAGNSALERALVRQRKAASGLVLASLPGLIVFALCVNALLLALVYLIVVRATGGDLSVPAAIALIVVSARFVDPLERAAQLGNALRGAGKAADRITAFLAEPGLPEATEPVVPGAPTITFENVGFGYHEGEHVLTDVSFTVAAGSTTAIVGPSGSGKSTLLRLAARYHDADTGRISVGGNDVRHQPSEALLRQVSPVFQDVYLFDQTITDNIRIGRPTATDAEVREAGRIARVDELVERLPDGWDTVVGEGGATLSGGERQRISIARALLKDAPIVLLDEATSALDPQNEAVVVRGLHELARDKTVVAVAHRLGTIQHADQILFVEDGRIVERGTHAELLDRAGRYAAFWNERSRATGWHLAPAPVSA